MSRSASPCPWRPRRRRAAPPTHRCRHHRWRRGEDVVLLTGHEDDLRAIDVAEDLLVGAGLVVGSQAAEQREGRARHRGKEGRHGVEHDVDVLGPLGVARVDRRVGRVERVVDVGKGVAAIEEHDDVLPGDPLARRGHGADVGAEAGVAVVDDDVGAGGERGVAGAKARVERVADFVVRSALILWSCRTRCHAELDSARPRPAPTHCAACGPCDLPSSASASTTRRRPRPGITGGAPSSYCRTATRLIAPPPKLVYSGTCRWSSPRWARRCRGLVASAAAKRHQRAGGISTRLPWSRRAPPRRIVPVVCIKRCMPPPNVFGSFK